MIIDWLITNWSNILEIIAYIISAATVIVKLTPTLKDDAFLKKVIQFIGKFIALNKTISKEEQNSVNKK